MRQYIIASVALAGLASATLLSTAGPADAKPMSSCQVKHSQCTERCIMRNGDGGACIARTCDVQHRGCGGESIEGQGTTAPRGKGKGAR
jgi:hypothetical protein